MQTLWPNPDNLNVKFAIHLLLKQNEIYYSSLFTDCPITATTTQTDIFCQRPVFFWYTVEFILNRYLCGERCVQVTLFLAIIFECSRNWYTCCQFLQILLYNSNKIKHVSWVVWLEYWAFCKIQSITLSTVG